MSTEPARTVPTLVTGDRQLSSWSLRPWLLLKHLGVSFEEVRLQLDTPAFAERIGHYSPTRRVPVLIDGTVTVWESLAICEYASELAGHRGWPGDAADRAHARAISAEMHAGFAALRQQWPMQASSRLVATLDAAGQADLARIDGLWQQALRHHRAAGPWLFGTYSIADAMYAPVVLRCRTYGADLSPEARRYMSTVLADPWIEAWLADAAAECAPPR